MLTKSNIVVKGTKSNMVVKVTEDQITPSL